MARLQEFKHEISYLKSRVELAQSSSIISMSQRTVFVFAPNATGTQPPNVFTVWATLLAAVALTRGPITIQFDPSPGNGAITVPGGDLSAHKDIWFVGAVLPGAQVAPTITVTAPFTNGYPIRISYLLVGYTGAAAPCINLTNSATGGEPNFQIDTNSIILTTGGQPFLQLDGTTNTVQALVSLFNDVFIQGAATVFKTLGNNSLLQIRMFDNATLSTNTISSAVVATTQVAVFSTAASYDPAQAAVVSPAGRLNAAFTYPSGSDKLFAKASFYETSPLTPPTQVAPGANTLILVGVVIPRTSGRLYAATTLPFGTTGIGTARISTQTRAAAAAVTITNGTAVGQKGPASAANPGCFSSTASGTIGFTVATTALTHDFVEYTSAAGLNFHYAYSGIVIPAAGSFSLNVPVAVCISVEATVGNITQQNNAANGPIGTLSVWEMD